MTSGVAEKGGDYKGTTRGVRRKCEKASRGGVREIEDGSRGGSKEEERDAGERSTGRCRAWTARPERGRMPEHRAKRDAKSAPVLSPPRLSIRRRGASIRRPWITFWILDVCLGASRMRA